MAKQTQVPRTKKQTVLALLTRRQGASIADIQRKTNWQPHSVRSFLSATVRKKLGLNVTNSLNKNNVRRYRIEEKGA
jgi:hypothetical protein